MKKLLFAVALLAIVGIGSKVQAASIYTVAVTTYPVDEAATMAAQVSGTHKVAKIVLSNSGATAQTVTVYKNAASTTTVSAVAVFVIPAAAGYYEVTGSDVLGINDAFSCPNLCIRKSATATTVNATILYR